MKKGILVSILIATAASVLLLSGMLARMTQLGGSLTLEEQAKGLKVRAWAPLSGQQGKPT